MDCGKAKEKLLDLIYEELPKEEAASVREHCGRCPSCQKEYERMAEVLGLSRRVPDPELPPYLNARTLARVRDGKRVERAGLWSRVFRPRYAMAAVVVIAASVVIVIGAERGFEPAGVAQERAAVSEDRREPDMAPPAPAEEMAAPPEAMEAATAEDQAAPAAAAPPVRKQDNELSRADGLSDRMADSRSQPSAGPSGAARPAPAPEGSRGKAAQPLPPPAAPAPPVPAPAAGAPADNLALSGGAASGSAAPPATSETKSAKGFGFMAPSAPAPGAITQSPAQAAPAPSTAPAKPAPENAPARVRESERRAETKDEGSSKSIAVEEEAEPAASAAATEPAPPPAPTPAQQLEQAARLEKEGKPGEALTLYQQALRGLGYVAGGKPPACSAPLQSAFEGARRCLAKLGRAAEAETMAKAAAASCPR